MKSLWCFLCITTETNTTRKEQNDNAAELDTGDNSGEYKVEAIWNSVVYTRESESGHLPGLYYLVSWKGYSKEKNTWEPASAVQYIRKLISSFNKDHSDKSTVTSPAINTISRLIVKLTKPFKQKQRQPKRRTTKRAKWDDKKESKAVWFSMESEAGRRLEICLLSAGASGNLYLNGWNYLQFYPAENWIALYSNQVLPLNINLGFSFSVLSPSWKVFSLTISIIFRFSFHIFLLSFGSFLSIDFRVWFSSPVSFIRLRGFSPVTWSFETYQFSYGARMFSFSPGFLLHVKERSLVPD